MKRTSARLRAVAIAFAVAITGLFGSPAAYARTGIASTYSTRDNGHRTASGIPLRNDAFTAAMFGVSLGSHVRVTNLRNHRSIIVRITDRGPYVRGRIIDLTPAAAHALAFNGLVPVSVEVI